ncbi:MAG: MFS transporter [Myxococcales bacterium]|nr:MFS transporter [Myxococcales bacterium]
MRDEIKRESLLRGSFLLVLPLTLLAYSLEAIIRAITPLIVLDRGGDAVMVGLVASAFALPSIIFRPIAGGLVDSGRHRTILRGGVIATAVGPILLLLLLPGTIYMLVVRFLHGTAWTFFSVSNHSLVAKLAPADRRGEASGLFMTMYALAGLIGPALGVALYTMSGEVAPVLVGVLVGSGAILVAIRIEVPESNRQPDSAPRAGGGPSFLARFVEPSALPWTLMLVTSYSAMSIFAVFPPVYALSVNAPVELLVPYFAIFGLAQAIAQPMAGPLADRLGRRRSMIIGCTVAAAGLIVAIVPSFATFTLAGFVFGLTQALVNPTISALTMERAPRHRIGTAMATYSMGYQVGIGLSSLLWGAMITLVDFSWVFVVAAGFQLLTVGLTLKLLPGRPVQSVAAP